MTKMTYAVAIDRAIAGDVDAEVVEKLEALKEQLAKRGGGKKSLTKTQKEGLELMERIIEVLADATDGMTATEVGDAVEVTCQRASALLKKLVTDERVRKDKVGKQVRFFLA
jgi:predicted transcriptional regulator